MINDFILLIEIAWWLFVLKTFWKFPNNDQAETFLFLANLWVNRKYRIYIIMSWKTKNKSINERKNWYLFTRYSAGYVITAKERTEKPILLIELTLSKQSISFNFVFGSYLVPTKSHWILNIFWAVIWILSDTTEAK